MSAGSDGADKSSTPSLARPPVAGDDDYVPDMGGKKRY